MNSKCAKCGNSLPEEAPDEGCPVCALKSALEAAGSGSESPGTEQAGACIGPYKLLEKIGEGGYGLVYMAEQGEPIRRRVALKIVKLGMDTKQVIARFEAERQALALMDHAGIARVLDAGSTATGRPFFVMELVRGVKITEYCDRESLSTRDRLELFIDVCHAVQHAHQKGIIHRDLKPSNILVTRNEGVALPKIIDFGIAKATQQPLTSKTVFTSFHQFIGTPAYMSPEQADFTSVDVDTRTDIYSLGVLLYELLTGHTPFEQGKLAGAGLDELRRAIREQDPPRPSTRLRTLNGAELTTVARYQQTEPPRLIHLVRGDLDWIVMKCLEKNRARRYETANALADDVERHLNHQPVSAAGPGAFYQIGKFVRRHRLGLAASMAVLVLLIGGTVVSSRQAIRALRAEREQTVLRDESEKARREAEAGRGRVEAALNEARTQRAQAQTALAETEKEKLEKEAALVEAQTQRSKALAAAEEARRQLERAETASALAGNETAKATAALEVSRTERARVEDLLRFMVFDLSDKLQRVGRVDLLGSVTEKVLGHYQTTAAEDSEEALPRRFMVFKNLGQVLALQGESDKAVSAYQTSLEIAGKLATRDPESVHWQIEISACHARMGEVWEGRGEWARAAEEFDRSLEIAETTAARAGADPLLQSQLLEGQIKRGDVLWAQTDKTRAQSAYQAGLRTALRLTQTDPERGDWQRDLSICYGKLGLLLLQDWKLEQALDLCKKALDIAQRWSAKDPANAQWQSHLAGCIENVATVLLAQKEARQALEHYRSAFKIRYNLANTDPANTEWQRDLLRGCFHYARALSYDSHRSKTFETFVESFKAIVYVPKKHLEFAGQLLTTNKKKGEELEPLQESLKVAQQLAEKDPGNLQWQDDLARSHSLMGELLLEAGEKKGALKEYQQALRIRRELIQSSNGALGFQYSLALAHANVAVAFQRLSRFEDASIEARNGVHILSLLSSAWPGNFAFLEGPRADSKDLGLEIALNPSQRDDFVTAFRRGFETAQKRGATSPDDIKVQEDWGDYCVEMAVLHLWVGEVPETTLHADRGVGVWQGLWKRWPTNAQYISKLSQACVALGAFQILNGQADQAIVTARRGLDLDRESMAFRGLLALGRLIDGQYEPARALLAEQRSVKLASRQTFPEAVLDDLRRLREKGFTAPNVEQFEQRLASDPGCKAR